MAITNGLITAAQYGVYTETTVPTGDRLNQWEEAIEIASGYVVEHTSRQFYKSDTGETPTATARYFDADMGVVAIDDCYSITTVELDYDGDGSHSTATTNYQALPAYGRDDILGDVAYTTLWPLPYLEWPCVRRRGSVKVTALWGWDTIPNLVERATCIITQDLLRDASANFGGLSINNETGLVVGSRIPDRALTLLERYVRHDRSPGAAGVA